MCKLTIDLDKIYTNIGEFNFYQTNIASKLFFSYIHKTIHKHFSYIRSSIDSILREDYDSTLFDIRYNEQNIPFGEIFFSITKFFVSEYNYIKIYSKKKQKSITNTDFIFIQETFDKIEQLLIFITREIIFNSQSLYSSHLKIRLASYIKKLNRTIIILRKYSLDIDIRQ